MRCAPPRGRVGRSEARPTRAVRAAARARVTLRPSAGKMTADDKRLFRSLEQQHADSSLSRSNSLIEGVQSHGGSPSSPFGDLTDHQMRKKLVHLIATLNASYPDYDFSTAKADSFTWKTGAECAPRRAAPRRVQRRARTGA